MHVTHRPQIRRRDSMRRAQHLPTSAHKQQEHGNRHYGMQPEINRRTSISLGSSRSGLAHQGRHPSFHPATKHKKMLRARCCTTHSPATQLARLTVCSNIEERAKRAPAAERKKARPKAGVSEPSQRWCAVATPRGGRPGIHPSSRS